MKKMIAFLMALVLALACMPALAEDALQEYTHPNMGYSLTLPAEWLAVDSTNVQEYIAAYNAGEITFAGTNAQTLQSLEVQIAETDCVVLINPYANNIVVTGMDVGMELTSDLFVMIMVPMLKEQISAQVPGYEFTAEGDVLTIGENEFIQLAGVSDLGGIMAYVDQIYHLNGTMMYVFNLTATTISGEEAVEAFYADAMNVLASFTVAQ